MAHVEKFGRGASGNMLEHYDRTKPSDHCILDSSLTCSNYNLAPSDKSQLERLRDVIGNKQEGVKGWAKCLNRKDVKVMCTWVVTMPQDLPANKEAAFFKETYSFLQARYGVEGDKNIISAYVHRDEKQPHLHFCFVPVVADQRSGKYKVSAKECITKTELTVFHRELRAHLEQALGCTVNVLNGATKDGNKTVKELKARTALAKEESAVKAFRSEQELRKAEATCYIEPAFTPNLAQRLAGMEEHDKQAVMPYRFYLQVRKTIVEGADAIKQLADVRDQSELVKQLNERLAALDSYYRGCRAKLAEAEKEAERLKGEAAKEYQRGYDKCLADNKRLLNNALLLDEIMNKLPEGRAAISELLHNARKQAKEETKNKNQEKENSNEHRSSGLVR